MAPDVNCFAEAQKAVVKVLYEDLYPKFIQSQRYKQLKGEIYLGSCFDIGSEEPKAKKEKKPRQTESYSTFTHFLETRNVEIEEPKTRRISFLGNLMRKYSSDDTGTILFLIAR